MIQNVIIDAVNYVVELTDEILIVDGVQSAGEIDYNAAKIRIAKDEDLVGKGVRPLVLMHEVVHRLLKERGFIKESNNEKLVDGLAAGIVNLIRVNPKLISYLQQID